MAISAGAVCDVKVSVVSPGVAVTGQLILPPVVTCVHNRAVLTFTQRLVTVRMEVPQQAHSCPSSLPGLSTDPWGGSRSQIKNSCSRPTDFQKPNDLMATCILSFAIFSQHLRHAKDKGTEEI